MTREFPLHQFAWKILGAVLKDTGRVKESLTYMHKSMQINPLDAEAHNNYGVSLQELGRYDEAEICFNQAIILESNYVEAFKNLGNTFKDQGKLYKAMIPYKKAISINPDDAEAHYNLGVTLKLLGKLEEAISSYSQAIELNHEYAEAHHNLGLTLLNSGKIKEGLDECEWRWKTDYGLSKQRHFLQPIWNGITSLKNKKILLWCEQGIGDTMNWSSCLPFVTSLSKQCIVECQEKLIPLLKRSFPNVEFITEDRRLDSERDDFDLHLPMGSLYKHFIDKIMQNAQPDAFLVPDPERVKFWRKRLKSVGKSPYIGISWKSSVLSPSRLEHYPSISEWSPVLRVPDITFINLQYTDYANDIAKVQDEFGVTVHNFEDIDQYNNIDDVAALSAALDMVVSTKITPPFISSAVGTSTKIANWRQSSYNNILTNPVTSSYKMFERNTSEPWDNVFSLIAEDISELTKN